jgi:putative addiction module component (TIGR02574 family)
MKPDLPLDQMSTKDKLQAMEALWESLAREGDEIPSPDWHRAVIDERLRKVEAGEAEFIPLEELKARRGK